MKTKIKRWASKITAKGVNKKQQELGIHTNSKRRTSRATARGGIKNNRKEMGITV